MHEKVTRFKLERGYAYVESATSGAKGWVNNAQLIWRLPDTNVPAATAPEDETEPSPDEEPPPEAEAPPLPEATAVPPTATPTNTPAVAPAKPQPTPRGAAPSIFNPY